MPEHRASGPPDHKERSRAIPPMLETVVSFVNTRNIEAGREEFHDPQAFARWVIGRGLAPTDIRFSHSDLERAIAVREGIRALLVANNGEQDAEDVAAVAALEQVAGSLPLRARFTGGRPAGWEPAGELPVDHVLAQLLATVMTAVADGSWGRLKACREPGCRWAFYDSSKNRSGIWCSMAVCGNASKQRAFVARRRTARMVRP